MTRENIAAALEAEGLKSDKTGFSIPEDREASVLVSTSGEIFTVDRVVRLELREGYTWIETTKREHFMFAYTAILGLRLMAGRERPLGFGR
jgi:hypothetical protein